MTDCEKFLPFSEYFAQWKIKNFRSSELLVSTTRTHNRMPPKRIWDNIIPTILVLDELREFFQVPIVLSSVYRSEKYNSTISGAAKKSQHQAFAAIDFHVRGVTPLEVREVLLAWRSGKKKFRLHHPIKQQAVKVKAGTIDQKPLMVQEESGKQFFNLAGGIGTYKTFVHLDTRGTNHSWLGRGVELADA